MLGMQPKRKAIAYITRLKNAEIELLVFEQPAAPDGGVQVPGGTVDPGETPLEAFFREVEEESGLRIQTEPRLLGEFPYFRHDIQEAQLRSFFHASVIGETRDSWDHRVFAGEEDAGLLFRYYWIKLSAAKGLLAGKQDAHLDLIG